MIPNTISAQHIVSALAAIDRDGVPRGRHGRRYELVHQGRRYPPKYTIALAAELATGTFLCSESFGGGVETNTYLRRLGFTVVVKGSQAPAPAVAAPTQQVRLGRVFLNLGVRQGEYRAMPEGKWKGFNKLTQEQFTRSPSAYRARIVGLITRAHQAGAEVVVLPAAALQVHKSIGIEAYAVPDVSLVVAGGADKHGEFAVVIRNGVVTEKFDAQGVHWVDADGFTVMAAISSTIGKAMDARYTPPVLSRTHPPNSGKPVLIVDVGHAQYSNRYAFNTLRCVARDVAARHGQPAALVLSSWMWATKGISLAWFKPEAQVVARRLSGDEDHDILDLLDVRGRQPPPDNPTERT